MYYKNNRSKALQLTESAVALSFGAGHFPAKRGAAGNQAVGEEEEEGEEEAQWHEAEGWFMGSTRAEAAVNT